jgi:hypothetical protein
MFSLAKRLLVLGLVGAFALAGTVFPIGSPAPAPLGVATAASYQAGAIDNQASFRVLPMSSPYYGGGGYPYPYPFNYNGPLGGALTGAADVIGATGGFLVSQQQAYLMKEQVMQARVDTRRKRFDERLYEREVGPTDEDERERARIESLRRSRNDPPVTEIWSGKALNDLLLAIRQQQAQGLKNPDVPLEEDVLRHLNVTSGAEGGGSLGVLRNEGQLQWPLALRGSAYAATTKRLDELAAQAYKQAAYGGVSADTIQGMSGAIDSLETQLKRHVANIAPADYMQAKRYLRDLEGALRVLGDPNVAKVVTRKLGAQGNTVNGLVTQMSRDGLRFAPATRGDEAAYAAVHTAMVAYTAPPTSYKTWDPLSK